MAPLLSPSAAAARPLQVATPAVSLAAPGSVSLGANFNLTVTFDNAGDTTGYGPFVDLLFPVNGADGAAGTDTPDGVDFTGATYLGSPVMAVEQTFPDDGGGSGCVDHPYARDTSGAYIQVCGTAGDKLVVLQLPFGSFTPSQPAVVVSVGASLSNLADLGTPLTLRARGGFRFGNTPLDDWCCDPVILVPTSDDGSGWPSDSLDPTLVSISKAYSGPEDETATGPNFPRQYTITVDVAPGQTVTDLDVTDELPNNLAFLSVDLISPAGSVVQTPTVGAAANPPNNRLVVNFPSVTGSATITFSYFVTQFDADGAPVVPPASGDDSTSDNRAGGVGDWTPIDPRDSGGADNVIAGGICPSCSILHTLNDRSIAVQKGVTVVIPVGATSPSPGDTLQYSLQFQVSDFFAFDQVMLTDTISDGQRFDMSFTPTLSLAGNGFSLAAAGMNAANYTVEPHYTGGGGPPPTDGTTIITLRASDEIVTRGQPTGRLIGGCIPTDGTGGPDPDCGGYNDGPTSGTITFRTIIQDEFSDDFPSGDESVDQGDVLADTVTVAGDLLDPADLTANGFSEADASNASVSIPRGQPEKSIYAVNGTTCGACPDVEVEPGDTLTFRLQYDLPTSDFEDLYLIDFLPLPVLDATEVTTFDPTVSVAAPTAGTAKFGPADSFYNSNPPASNIVPAISTSASGNSVQFTYGNYDDPSVPSPSTAVDILFTVTVSNEPFTDRLLLTNQLRVHEGSTNSTDTDDDGIIQFTLLEPFLLVKKGVIATDQAAGVFSPGTTGPVAFSPPGSAGTRFGGTISSDGLASNPVDSNLSGVDADDLVSFAIVIENQGSSPAGAFDIIVTDTLQPGFVIPGGGLNLTVTKGDGSAVSYLGTDTDLFGAGIELVDPGLGVGVCEAYHPTDGSNLIVITYDLQIDPSAEPNQVITNTAEVTNYAGEEGGPDHTGDGPNAAFQDDADTTIADVGLVKDLTDTNQGFTSGLQVAIGEIVEYTLTVTIPEGSSTGVTLTDTLDQGLAFVALDSVTASSGDLTWTGPATAVFGEVPGGSALAEDQARRMTVAFGDLTNINTDDNVAETITLVYRVVVLNSAGNQDSPVTLLNNTAAWNWTEGTASAFGPEVTVVEPVLQVDKTVDLTMADAGDTVTFTVVIDHSGATGSDAFEAAWTDTVPAGMTYVPLSLSHTAGTAPDSLDASGAPTLAAGWTNFPIGTTSTLTFQATLDATVSPGQVLTNTAVVTWTSLPTDVTTAQTANNSLSVERTGDTTNPGGAVNDHLASDDAIVTVFSAPDKSIVATSESHTGVVSSLESVAIGEIVRYRLQFRLAEGTALDFQLQDRLPSGMQFLDDGTAMAALVANDAGIGSTTLAGAGLNVSGNETTVGSITPTFVLPDVAVSSAAGSDDDVYGSGTDVYFKLGDLTNDDRDDDHEFVVVEFNAIVMNHSSNQAYNNATGATATSNRDNEFRPRINGVDGENSNSVRVRVAEPLIANLNKTVTLAPSDADDPLEYTLTFGNTSSGFRAAAAFDLQLLDTLGSDSTLTGVSVSAPGYAIVTDNSVGNTVDVLIDRLDPGDSVTITVDAVVNSDTPIGIDIGNTAGLTYTSLPGSGTSGNPTGSTAGTAGSATGERTGTSGVGGLNDYVDSASVDLSLDDPAVSKTISATSVTSTASGEYDLGIVDLVIGEQVTFEITVTLPEGTAIPLVITDTLPTIPPQAGILRAISASLVSVGGNLSAVPALPAPGPFGIISDSDSDTFEDTVVFDFGDVTNTPDNIEDSDDQIVLQVVARVENTSGNQNGDQLTNNVVVDAGGETGSASVDVELVEPELQIGKLADDDTPGLGQTVTYTLTVSHLGSSTADAEEVVVTDTIPTGLTYVGGSASAPAGWTANEAGAPTLVFSGSLSQDDASVVFTYQATVDLPPSANVSDVIDNTADLSWTSVPGADANERDGSGGVDDYSSSAEESVTVTGIDLTLTKDDGSISAVPGDTIAYTLTIENVGNAGATGVVITDVIPQYTTFNAGSSSLGWVCLPDGTAGSTCSYNQGAMAAGQTIVLTLAVDVDSTVPALVELISNSASVGDDGTNGIEPTPDDNSDSDDTPLGAFPDLSITKDDGLSIISDGTVLTYQMDIANIGDQDATGVVVSDMVPANTIFNPAGSTFGWSCTPDNNAGSACEFTVGDLVAGDGLTIFFQVTVDSPLDPGVTQIVNTVTVADDGTNGPEPDLDNNTATDTDNIATDVNADLVKSLDDTDQIFTGPGDAAIGEILTYELVLTVPPGTMADVVLTDTLDQGLAYVACEPVVASDPALTASAGSLSDICNNATVSAVPGGSLEPVDQGRSISFDFDNITNGDDEDQTLTLRYTVVVLDSLGNQRGGLLNNAAVVTWVGDGLSAAASEVELVEPTLTLDKSAEPTVVLNNGLVTFTLQIGSDIESDSDAFDLILEDTLPPELVYEPGTLIWTGVGQAPTTIIDGGAPLLQVTWDSFPQGSISEIQYRARLQGVAPGQGVSNDAFLEWSSMPGDFDAPFALSSHNELANERVYDPGSPVDVYGVGASATVSAPRLPATGFPPTSRSLRGPDPSESNVTALPDFRLKIDKLRLNSAIVGVPTDDEGWDLTWLSGQVGYLEGTAFPTLPGNTALTGHVLLPGGTPGPFATLDELVWGDRIEIETQGLRFVYEVRQVRRVLPENLSVLRHETLDWLTLVTCEAYDAGSSSYLHRLVVRAVLVSVESIDG